MKIKINNEELLYFLALVIALFLRFYDLGGIPLSEYEAQWAYQAFQISKGQMINIGPQPAYIILTSGLFSVFGSSDAIARLLPALVGNAILFIPFLLRDKLGRTVALILAFALAIDPGLVSLSRVAGGPMLALIFTLLTMVFLLEENATLAGILLGFTLLSGPQAIMGLVVLTALYFTYILILKKEIPLPKVDWKRVGLELALTILIVGTYLLRFPNGISALGSSFAEFFNGFTRASNVRFGSLIFALVTYQLIAIVFAIFIIIKTRKNLGAIIKAALLFILVVLAFLFIYPSREIYDLIWVLVPLWMLASFGLEKFFQRKASVSWILVFSQAALVFTLFVLTWFTFINLSTLAQPPLLGNFLHAMFTGQFDLVAQFDSLTKAYVARISILILLPLLTILVTVLLGLWWDMKDAWTSFGWGVIAFLLIFVASSSISSMYSRSKRVNDLWPPGTTAGYPDYLLTTVEDLSEANVGTRQDIDIVSQVDSHVLSWVFRQMPNFEYDSQIAYNELPSIVITDDPDGNPDLNSSYRGQSFVISQNRAWLGGMIPPNFPGWFAFKNTSPTQESIIVWARSDLFFDDVPVFEEVLVDESVPIEISPAN